MPGSTFVQSQLDPRDVQEWDGDRWRIVGHAACEWCDGTGRRDDDSYCPECWHTAGGHR